MGISWTQSKIREISSDVLTHLGCAKSFFLFIVPFSMSHDPAAYFFQSSGYAVFVLVLFLFCVCQETVISLMYLVLPDFIL